MGGQVWGRKWDGERATPRTACFPRDPIWAPTSSYLPASLQAVTFKRCEPLQSQELGVGNKQGLSCLYPHPGGGCSKFLAKWGQEGHPSSGHLDWCQVSAVSSTRCGDGPSCGGFEMPHLAGTGHRAAGQGAEIIAGGVKDASERWGWGPRSPPLHYYPAH